MNKQERFDYISKQIEELQGVISVMEETTLLSDVDFNSARLILLESSQRLTAEAGELQADLYSKLDQQTDRLILSIRSRHASTERLTKDINDCTECPCCKEGMVFYRISVSNGHISARCTTNNCINYQE